MVKKAVGIIVLAAFVAMATTAFAADVYVTKNGKKFHTEICPLIQNKQVTKMDDAQAMKEGRTPCSKCFKDKVAKVNQVEKKK